ncbi:pectinesterase family protein [Ereboglobus luteus]|nr:pectinesterase family protein [Ereboglobus luteus]
MRPAFLLRSLVIVAASLACAVLFAGKVANNPKIRIVLVGDSTVTDNAGWGAGFAQFLTEDAVCVNTARGGRSSMSFIKEGRWENALALKADYYLVQFGHNDEPGKPGRSTTMEEYRAYMNQYVDEARAAGATPVLVTSLVRRQFGKKDPHKINSSLNVRAEVVRDIARQKNVPLVELHDLSKALCEKLGREGCLVFSPKKENGAYDGTHLNAEGYIPFGRIVANELKRVVPALAPFIRDEPKNAKPVARESRYDAVVAFDGSGTHTTIQAAIAAAPSGASKPHVILVKPAVYQGQVIIPRDKPFIHLIGEPGETKATVITYGLNVYEPKTDEKIPHKGTGVVVLADDFRAENITFENTAGDRGQALALRVDGDRAVFENCRMLGWQDTLMANKGRQYYKNCHVEGRVDFIYGGATAVFDGCVIHSKNGGYVTAASTPREARFGYVFLRCKLTGDPAPWDAGKPPPKKPPQAFLGRPWRPHAHVAFIECELGGHIKPEGWNNWRKEENEKTARYFEYKNTGPGADPAARAAWSRQLTDGEAKLYTVENIFGDWRP